MLRTVAEAKKTECQETFNNAGPALVGGGGFSTFCIHTNCMAWRWADSDVERMTLETELGKPEGDGWVLSDTKSNSVDFQYWSRPRPNRRGYCGKIGKPGYDA